MHRQTPLSLTLVTILLAVAAGQVLPAGPAMAANAYVIQQQIHLQGRMLLGYLRQAKEAGLRGDPWGMDYALHEARRLSNTLLLAERLQRSDQSSQAAYPPVKIRGKKLNVPLEEGLDIDASLPSGRWERLNELEQEAGTIPLKEVRDAITRAQQYLQAQPQALGAALIATNQALGQIHWRQGLEPLPWVKARDQLLQAYALTLDARPEAFGELTRAYDLLAGLPDGQVYARYLATLLQAPVANVRALRGLVQQVDTQVETLRDAAEQALFGSVGVNQGGLGRPAR